MNISKEKLMIFMARRQFGIKELSAASKVSRNTISKIKNGKLNQVEPSTLGKLAEALKADILDLM